ncbi:MAG: LuxR C-terminal-related transcriptional regulator [Lachnospiraceae bacterium]|nr:LuxR C-terminal-related transcriptional regulator [Lachnospiraceae bacterium]
MDYIKIPRAFQKLKKAEDLFVPVILTASAGYGKTAAVNYYYRRKKTITLHCRDGRLDEMPPQESIRATVVIIEDMQFLSDQESVDYIRELLVSGGRQLVMLTRGTVPRCFAYDEQDFGFIRIQEADLAFGPKETEAFFREKGISLSAEDLARVTEASKGYARALYFYAVRMENGEHFSPELEQAVYRDIYHLWDGRDWQLYPEEYVQFVLSVCNYETFSAEMARYLSGNPATERLIDHCIENMSQLRITKEGYEFRPEIRGFYCWEQKRLWSAEQIAENYHKAADYFRERGDIPNALKHYHNAGDRNMLMELLVQNANAHPGAAHYMATREYYLELSDEEIRRSPILMAGMSMLYDMNLQPDKSDEWYREIERCVNDRNASPEKRREARGRLAYLDIALPHKGTKGILRILRNVFKLAVKGDISLPEFSVTSNMPSLMNGGLDFSEWSIKDNQIAKHMEQPLCFLLGRFGKGLVTIALAESGFEKGTMSSYEVMTRCNDGYEEAAYGGKIEMCFASVGVQVRQHLLEGRLPSAKRILELFREKAELEKAEHLKENLEAFSVWLSLYSGASETVKAYIDKIPDARVSFYTMDRYRHMVRLRCLIAEDRLEEALDLADFLVAYFSDYERHFYRIECEMLRAVLLFRFGNEHWRERFFDSIHLAERFHFVRIFALEGASLLPLLTELSEHEKLSEQDEAFLSDIIEECKQVAYSYPDYLKQIPKENVQLTEREMQVLSMLCEGLPMNEISEKLEITYDGLKKHNRNIYRKLGAKDRAEAERKASQLGLVFRMGG